MKVTDVVKDPKKVFIIERIIDKQKLHLPKLAAEKGMPGMIAADLNAAAYLEMLQALGAMSTKQLEAVLAKDAMP